MDGSQNTLMHVQINTYMSFAKDVLPRIRSLGYNALQIMAVQEHAYYGSFGYHVTNFFAVGTLFSSCKLLCKLRDAHIVGQSRVELSLSGNLHAHDYSMQATARQRCYLQTCGRRCKRWPVWRKH